MNLHVFYVNRKNSFLIFLVFIVYYYELWVLFLKSSDVGLGGREVKFIIYAKARKRDFILKYGYFVEIIKNCGRIMQRV